jgi:hypothetical protein
MVEARGAFFRTAEAHHEAVSTREHEPRGVKHAEGMPCLAHMRGQCVHRLVLREDRDLHILRDLHPLTLRRGATITISKTARGTTAVIAITARRAAFTTRTESATTGRARAAGAITARRRAATASTITKAATTTTIIPATALRAVFRAGIALFDLLLFAKLAHPCRHHFQIGKVNQTGLRLRLVVGAGFGFGHTIGRERGRDYASNQLCRQLCSCGVFLAWRYGNNLHGSPNPSLFSTASPSASRPRRSMARAFCASATRTRSERCRCRRW